VPRTEATDPELPAPLVSGVLTDLAVPDLPALERDLGVFLGNLEQMGQRLTHDPEGGGLYPWLLAGVTAAVACEIARRQLRRPIVPVLSLPGAPGPFDPPLTR
jgi:hypothetical protein